MTIQPYQAMLTARKYFYTSSIFLLFFLLAQHSFATHIRAGDIIAELVSGTTYRFRIVMYTDTRSQADSPFLRMDWGDGTSNDVIRFIDKQQIGNNTYLNVYGRGDGSDADNWFTHTFPAPGTYRVSFTEQNRNNNVLNMTNSGLTPFSVSMTIVINPSLGANRSPILTVSPIDLACTGQKYFHNPGAFDPDGDSLAFRFTTPRQSSNTNVNGYQDPNDDDFEGGLEDAPDQPATFTIDARTGDLVWDAPGQAGEYNIAFVVEEWRFGIKIGEVVRDMQVLVEDCSNKRPRLTVPDVCVVADNDDPATITDIINQAITATDPDNDRIVISSELTQAVYSTNEVGVGAVASFTFPSSPQNSPASGTFIWDTDVAHVRREPYIVVFKVEDRPVQGTKLVDIQSMLITVKGPPVRNLTAVPNGRAMNLAWSDYRLQLPGFTNPQFEAMTYVVWRREGCSAVVDCNENPSDEGYIPIAELPLTANAFTDAGPLKIGLNYSYVITVKYPEPRGGVSQASVEACAFIPINSPILTHVTVDFTNDAATDGITKINWLRAKPTEGNITAQFAPPYRYELFRATGLISSAFTKIHTVTDNTGNQINFNFTDTGLNTKDNPYLYKVEWYTAAGTGTEARLLPSDSSSSVRLTATPATNSIVLTWDYNVAWTNQNQTHAIYRALEGTPKAGFVKIGEVFVGQRRFVDDGSFNNECLDPDKIYCYYVKTKGSYNNTLIPEPIEKLLNDSQIDCASPIDNTPPPPPVLAIVPTVCEDLTGVECSDEVSPPDPLQNKLYWTPFRTGSICLDDIATYRLYFRQAGATNFTLIDNPPMPQPTLDTVFVHTEQFLPEVLPGMISQAGCYYVTAVDKRGNESDSSNVVCQDNCLSYRLPNVFTPNQDGSNDLFKPCPEPLFVRTVKFTVFNRWGGRVFQRNDDILLNWDGKNEAGQDLPQGSYYYEIEVNFVTIDPQKAVQKFKGWIQLLR
jgi:gliding motility-associated-like protein